MLEILVVLRNYTRSFGMKLQLRVCRLDVYTETFSMNGIHGQAFPCGSTIITIIITIIILLEDVQCLYSQYNKYLHTKLMISIDGQIHVDLCQHIMHAHILEYLRRNIPNVCSLTRHLRLRRSSLKIYGWSQPGKLRELGQFILFGLIE